MTALHPALRSAFPAPFARFGETLGPPCAEATPVSALLPTAATRYAAGFPGGERRAALSLWSQHYLLALVPCATAATLAARHDLPVALDGMGAVLTEAGQPCRLCVPHAGCATAEACPVRRLAPLLRGHLAPLADALAGAGLSPLILWSNAATVLAWSLDVIDAPEADRAAIRTAMSARSWADGAPNPFHPVLHPIDGTRPAQRRVCCLRYRLGCTGRCPDCPVTPRRPPDIGRPR